jgi:hypothetical protein
MHNVILLSRQPRIVVDRNPHALPPGSGELSITIRR